MGTILSHTSTINHYFSEINGYKPMTREQEVLCFEQYKNGDQSARELIIKHNLAFVVNRAKMWSNCGESVEDLIQCGNIALITAVDSFDHTSGNKFISYAVFAIDHAIAEFATSKKNLVRQTNNVRLGHKVWKIRKDFFQAEHREPIAEEIADILETEYGIKVNDLRDLLPLSVARFECNDTEEDETYQNNEIALATASTNEYETKADQEELIRVLTKRINRLTDRDKQIVRMHFGIGCTELDNETIAEQFNMTAERVRQIIANAIKRMK